MDMLSQEIATVRGTGTIPKIPQVLPRISVDLTDTPTKKRKFEESTAQQPSYAGTEAALPGVQSLLPGH